MKHHSILVVDDEEVFAKNLAKLLSHRGYKASYAISGAGAIAELDQTIIDLILLDLRMPGLSGVDTCREIFRRNPNVRVILLTGHGNMDEAFEAIKIGASGCLRKPFELDELVSKIEEDGYHHEMVHR